MPYSYIQTIDAGTLTAASSIVTGSYTLTAGNRVMIVACFFANTDKTTGCLDTNGNVWDKWGSNINPGGAGVTYVGFECKNITVGGATVITVGLSASTANGGIAGVEVSGLNSSAAVQTTASNWQTAVAATADAVTSGNMTPTGQPAMVFGFVQDSGNSNSILAGTGETNFPCPNCSVINAGSATVIALKRITSTGAVASTATPSTAGHAFASLATIVSEAGGGGIVDEDFFLPPLGECATLITRRDVPRRRRWG